MKVAVFVYNFPHRKVQDFLFKLFLEGVQVESVLAANPVKLAMPEPSVRVKPRYRGLVHPREICERFGWSYTVIDHKSEECAQTLRRLDIDLGIVAGARILPMVVISSVRIGIVNIHPGLIPDVRGMDALQWAIYDQKPLGVTAHFMDERVDAGRLILCREIEEYADDTLIDLSLRLHDMQVEILPEVLARPLCRDRHQNTQPHFFPISRLQARE